MSIILPCVQFFLDDYTYLAAIFLLSFISLCIWRLIRG